MDQNLLVDQIADGKRLVVKLSQEGFGVVAAFWLYTFESGQWYLYLATPVVDEQGIRKGYLRLLKTVREIPAPFWVGPFEVKLISPKSPLAKAVLEAQRRSPPTLTSHNVGRVIEGVNIEGSYIYPSPTVTPIPG